MGDLSKLLSIQKAYLGYMEEENGNTVFGELYANRHKDNAFRNADWCMMFISETARMAGIGSEVIPDTASCPTFYNTAKKNGWILGKDEAVCIGDIVVIMWTSNTDGKPDHVGVITSISGDTFKITEGNHGVKGFSRPCVYNDRTLKRTDKIVYAIVRPPYKVSNAEKIYADLKEVNSLLYANE